MFAWFDKRLGLFLRVIAFCAGLQAVLSAVEAYREGRVGYLTYYHQVMTRELALFFGVAFIIGSVLPASWLRYVVSIGQKKKNKKRLNKDSSGKK